jgi:nitroreductase|uniref:Nitroreductase domain-containing protein n=1 Tax=Desulfomonile tiedjei TaxID=2358 RepID=A0A7C4ASM0_9BACT
MKLEDAIKSRRSIRAFLPKPVSRDTLTKVVRLARWAPSWGNTQPWEVVIADGQKAQELARLFVEEGQRGAKPRPDIEMPMDFPEVHKNRYMKLGKDLLTALGIERSDKAARSQHYLNMYRFFGAPAVIYLLIDHGLNVPYACLDIGSIGTTICYAALAEGLGTIYLAAAMHFPDIVRSVLNIPDNKKVVIGIAVGYPDLQKAGAIFRSDRVSVEDMMRFA